MSAPVAPKAVLLDSEYSAYDQTQTDWGIADGDVLVVRTERGGCCVAVMVSAWPTIARVTGMTDEELDDLGFHVLGPLADVTHIEAYSVAGITDYLPSFTLAMSLDPATAQPSEMSRCTCIEGIMTEGQHHESSCTLVWFGLGEPAR